MEWRGAGGFHITLQRCRVRRITRPIRATRGRRWMRSGWDHLVLSGDSGIDTWELDEDTDLANRLCDKTIRNARMKVKPTPPIKSLLRR